MFSNKDQIDTFLFDWIKYEGLIMLFWITRISKFIK